MVNFLAGNLEVLRGLCAALREVLLLLVQLVDDLILVGDLIIEALDGVVSEDKRFSSGQNVFIPALPVGLLLLKFSDGHFDVSDVFLNKNIFLLEALFVVGSLGENMFPLAL